MGIASAACVRTSSCRLAEYLAASRCIVSEPLRNSLPVQLVENVHYLGFRSVNECIAKCALLLEDRSRAEEMRRKNWEYYINEVAPVKHVHNLLERAFRDDVHLEGYVHVKD